MAVTYIRIRVYSENVTKLNKIEVALKNKVIKADLHPSLEAGDVVSGVVAMGDLSDETYLYFGFFITGKDDIKGYGLKIKNFLTSANKTGLTKVDAYYNNNCTHDEDNPQPDALTKGYEWLI